MRAPAKPRTSLQSPGAATRGETSQHERRRISSFRAAVLVGAAAGFLLYRVAPDVGEKALYEDEAIAGLIAMRPLPEVLDTVLVDRGGAPLHFVLAHAMFWLDTSAEALRLLSMLSALGAVLLCFDVARRLGGAVAGVVAAVVAASSTALAVYGSFGRMYALFVVVAALFADLFVRALQAPTLGSVAAASAAGWLLPAAHPYGAILAFAALVAAAFVWRRRPQRAAWPVAVAVVAAIPFLLADLRLADRASVGGSGKGLASPGEAWNELVAALSSFAGGDGLPFVFFAVLAVAGTVIAARREPAFGVLAASTVVAPVLFVVVRSGSPADLSPRHLFYGLPLWAAAIGVAASRMPVPAAALVALVAVTSPPSALRDPRELGIATVAPDDAVEVHARENDLLLPYSPAFLAGLGGVHGALALPHGPADDVVRALEHAAEPIGNVYLAVPTEPWTVRPLTGPFDRAGALAAAVTAADQYAKTPNFPRWREWLEPGLCSALRRYTAAPWQGNESRSRSSPARRTAPRLPAACAGRG
jgi:hypothetical protein